MLGLDAATGTVVLPLWLAAGAAVTLFVIVCALALNRSGFSGLAGVLFGFTVVLIGAGLAWTVSDWAATRDRVAERRALDQRSTELTTQAIAPGSALACLDAAAGDAVEAACEKAIFGTPETIASAVSYVSARLALLAEGSEFASRSDKSYETALAPLRRALEADRFGIVAHVFSIRDSCTALLCDGLALLHDPSRVQANLRELTFNSYITRHTAEWAVRGSRPATPVADAPAANPYNTASAPPPSPSQPTGTPLPSKYDFPSAASIPPVSIMNAEPAAPPASAPAVKQAPAANTPIPVRKPQQVRAAPPRPAGSNPAAPPTANPDVPVQIGPPLPAPTGGAGQSLR